MVVAGQQQDTPVGMAAGEVSMPKDVATAVDARAFAVPHGIDAVVFGVAEQAGLLRAPDGRRRQVFVDARLEVDVVVLEVLACFPKLLVEAAEW